MCSKKLKTKTIQNNCTNYLPHSPNNNVISLIFYTEMIATTNHSLIEIQKMKPA